MATVSVPCAGANRTPISFLYETTITRKRVVGFGRETGDLNPIHFETAAAQAAFGGSCPGPVVHGMLVLSCIAPAVNEHVGNNAMMSGLGDWVPRNYVLHNERVYYEVTETDFNQRGELTVIRLQARIYVIRDGRQLEFTKNPVEFKLRLRG